MKLLGVVIAIVAIVMSIDPGADMEIVTPGFLIDNNATIEVDFDRLDASNPVIYTGHSRFSRKEQIILMAECVEDAIAVCQDANIYPLGSWYKADELTSEVLKGDKSVILAAEIAVAFFNYRIGGN